MAGRPIARKRLWRTTAAVLTAGAVAAAPLAPLAQTPSGDPVEVRVGAAEGFTRVEFAGVIGARARIRQDGRTVVIRVGSTAAPDISRLRVDPPAGVERVETRSVPGATEVLITLAETAAARFGHADGAAWVNLYPPGAPAAAAERAAGAAVPASGVVPVTARVEGDRLTLSFAWAAPAPAAVFRRGEAIWVVFDAAARLDLTGAPADLGPARNIRWVRGPDFTAVRIEAPGEIPPSARLEGAVWTVGIGGAPEPPEARVTLGREDDAGPTAMIAAVAGASRVIWIPDPALGDRFAVVPARGPTKGLVRERRLVDLTLLASAQGLALAPRAGDLNVTVSGDLVRVTRPGGLALSPPSAARARADLPPGAPQAAPMPGLILDVWADTGHADFGARYRQLQAAAAREGGTEGRPPIEARLALARFLVGSGLHYEAIGVLNDLARDQRLLAEPEVRGLRGAARAAIGRLAEAQADFAAAPLAHDRASAIWRGYIAARQGQWTEARRAFAEGARAIDLFPQLWRARFATAHAEAALATGDLTAARALIAYALSQDIGPAEQLEVRLVQARLFEAEGDAPRALAVYRAMANCELEGISTPARLHATRLALAAGQLTPAQAVRELEPLRFRWRGGAVELQVIRTLGGIYLSQGRYREALTALRGVGGRLPDLPEATQLQQDLAAAFRTLFLDGGADGLEPIQALALFYDFRELTPVGAEGDDMVRRLARRLVDVDLLDQAAELLDYQVEHRLEGVAKASVATDLAAIRLMDRDAEGALRALWGSRTTLLPAAMQAERRALEARALMMLARYDHALEVLGRDDSPAAQDVRAEVFWKQQRWTEAAQLYERRLGERWRQDGPLGPDEETRLIRAGVGYSLAGDTAALARLSQRWGRFADEARNPESIRIALAGPHDLGGPPDLARLTATVDTFAGWVAAMKQRLRDRADAAA